MTHFPCAGRFICSLFIVFILTFHLTGCAELKHQFSFDSNQSDTASSPPTSDDSNQPLSPDNDNIYKPVSIGDDTGNNIDYLPIIPTDGDGCDTADDSSDNNTISAPIQSKLDEALDFYQASKDFWQKGELDNALQALDQGYALITEVDAFDQPKLIQQKDDLRFMISKLILEIYASRHITAKGNHNAIPVIMNEHVQKEIDLFTKDKCRSFFDASYRRSGLYRKYIVEEMRKAGIPEELSWLPLIESGFKVNALSRARALGLWQFISSTGHKFGLKRTLYIDERMDPYKSTKAAIEYLKELHEIFGDWQTVLAAYNCGEGRVLRTIRDQNVNYLDDFWDLYQRLPRETARYVPKFMALLHIINHPKQYGIDKIKLDDPVKFDVQKISKQAYLKDIAEAIDLKEKDLVALNPELRYKLLPPEEYPLKIPMGKKETLIASIDKIPEYALTHPGLIYHRVRPGETLSTIARRYHTKVNTIARYNNIYRKNYIAAGKILKIPQSGRLPESDESKIVTYYVRRGDSLWTLANRYDTTTKKIQAFNKLRTVNLSIGQILKIPTGPHHGLGLYKVRKGDSPSRIASKHNMSLNQLLRLNDLTKKSTIYPGQQLYVQE